jgi:hypothetical protein
MYWNFVAIDGVIKNQLENGTFLKRNLFPSWGEGKKTPNLLGPLERANLIHWYSTVGVPLPSAEEAYRLSFRNVVFPS